MKNALDLYTSQDIRQKMINNILSKDVLGMEYDAIMGNILDAMNKGKFEVLVNVPNLLQKDMCTLFGLLDFLVTPVDGKEMLVISWHTSDTLVAKRTANDLKMFE